MSRVTFPRVSSLCRSRSWMLHWLEEPYVTPEEVCVAYAVKTQEETTHNESEKTFAAISKPHQLFLSYRLSPLSLSLSLTTFNFSILYWHGCQVNNNKNNTTQYWNEKQYISLSQLKQIAIEKNCRHCISSLPLSFRYSHCIFLNRCLCCSETRRG